jgi:hypothetical protein
MPYVSFPPNNEATAFFREMPDVDAFETLVSITPMHATKSARGTLKSPLNEMPVRNGEAGKKRETASWLSFLVYVGGLASSKRPDRSGLGQYGPFPRCKTPPDGRSFRSAGDVRASLRRLSQARC